MLALGCPVSVFRNPFFELICSEGLFEVSFGGASEGLFDAWKAQNPPKGLLKDAWETPYPRKGVI